jgi:hypothetical protein
LRKVLRTEVVNDNRQVQVCEVGVRRQRVQLSQNFDGVGTTVTINCTEQRLAIP